MMICSVLATRFDNTAPLAGYEGSTGHMLRVTSSMQASLFSKTTRLGSVR